MLNLFCSQHQVCVSVCVCEIRPPHFHSFKKAKFKGGGGTTNWTIAWFSCGLKIRPVADQLFLREQCVGLLYIQWTYTHFHTFNF